MKIKMTALELIMHLAEGSTTPNTLTHIAKIAKETVDALKEQEEMQPFIDMTNEAYLRGVRHGQGVAPQRTWVGLTDEEVTICHSLAVLSKKHDGTDPSFTTLLHQQIEAKLKEKNG